MGRRGEARARGGRRIPGLRVALVVYLSVVLSGVTGAVGHALWSQQGAVTATVSIAEFAPAAVEASSIRCEASSAGTAAASLAVAFDASPGATSYTLVLRAEDGRTTGPITISGTSGEIPLEAAAPEEGQERYALRIQPFREGAAAGGEAAYRAVLVERSPDRDARIECGPYAGTGF